VKNPACGWAHDRYKTQSQWPLLPLIGTMPSETDDGVPVVLELRNCTGGCGSTLALEVPAP
jgi:hypothetical protein